MASTMVAALTMVLDLIMVVTVMHLSFTPLFPDLGDVFVTVAGSGIAADIFVAVFVKIGLLAHVHV